ncbi:uncharacterized protein LOC130744292 [Lotus japonicus]|uniref:uncharacterized protein LOC130744292 n=1 Tax=Lotus japonicus TaxID=34305 RepID=UPI00258FCEBB|nr:uncharacterized protein LOC130744292 [Lotus japonicus]
MERGSQMSSGSSMTHGSVRGTTRVCDCGAESKLVTCWVGENVGRRCYGCGKYHVYGRRLCSYFHWYDGEGNVRDRKVISGLIRKLEVHKKKEIYLTRCCVIGWGLSAVFLLVIVMLLLKIYLRI